MEEKKPFTEGVGFADMLSFGLGDHGDPALVQVLLQKEELNNAASFTGGIDSCLAHLAVVYHQKTSTGQILDKVTHLCVNDSACFPLYHHKAVLAALVGRALGDEMGR